MRCLGRTKNGHRCSKQCKFIFCKQHFNCWFRVSKYILGVPALLLVLLQISDYFPEVWSNEKELNVFAPLFKENDSKSFNILITRFENYLSEENTYCIGRSIEENINYLKSNRQISSPVNVIYVDSILSAKNTRNALRIQKKHNADLIIYGLVQNIITNCDSIDVNMRYNINDDILPKDLKRVRINSSKHDLNYIKTTPFEIQRGTLQIDRYSINNWLKILIAVKNKNFKNLEIDIKQILSDSTLNDFKKRKRIYHLGDLYFNVKKFDEAIQVYKEIVKIKPTARAYRSLGATYTKQEKFRLAEDYFKKAAIISPKYKKLYIDWGNMFYFKKEYKKAINKYNLRLEIDSTESFVYDNIGLAYFRLKDYDKALQFYNFGLKRNSLDASIYSGIGHVYKKQNLNKKAIEYYTKAINLDSTSFLPYSHRGYVYLNMGEYQKALNDLSSYISVNPTEFEDYCNRASAYISIGDLNKAQKDCEKAIILNDKNSVPFTHLANIYYNRKQYEEAIRFFNKAIILDTLPSSYRNRKLSSAYLRLKKYDFAIKKIDKAISIDSLNSVNYYVKGLILELKKDFKNALKNYSKAVSIDSTYASAIHGKGNVKFKIGKYSEAVEDMKLALDLEPSLHYKFDYFYFSCCKYWYCSVTILFCVIFLIFRKKVIVPKIVGNFNKIYNYITDINLKRT